MATVLTDSELALLPAAQAKQEPDPDKRPSLLELVKERLQKEGKVRACCPPAPLPVPACPSLVPFSWAISR